MENREVLRRFEVSLSEQLVQDVMAPGKTFQSEIWAPGTPEDPNEQQSCILLEKSSDTLIRLLVTVYKLAGDKTLDGSEKIPVPQEGEGDGTKADTSESEQTPKAELTECSSQTDVVEFAPVKPEVATVCNQTDPVEFAPPTPDMTEVSNQTDAVEFAPPKPEVVEVGNQTDQTPVTEGSVQTTGTEMLDCFMQTDITQLLESACQTEIETVECEMQTDIKNFLETSMQTIVKEFLSCPVQTELDMFEQETQTELEQRDNIAQTFNPELLQRSAQTDHLPLVDGIMQTDVAPITEGSAQTDNPILVEGVMQTDLEVSEMEMQTDISIALRSEQHSQTVIDVADSETQVVIPTEEGMCQTDIKELVDSEFQTELLVEDQEVQASVDCSPMPTQTDMSMALQAENYTQVEISTDDQFTQVELYTDNKDTQVELSTYDQHTQVELSTDDQHTQVELSTDNQHTQVELSTGEQHTQVETSTDEQRTQVEPSTDEQHTQVELSTDEQHTQVELSTDEQQSQTAETELPLTQSSDGQDVETLPPPPDGLLLDECIPVTEEIISSPKSRGELKSRWVQAVVESRNKTIQANGPDDPASTVGDAPLIEIQPTATRKEDGCQTDPVTIIIGDASFLMKKIKSSAISPSRVTGAGNEIEIEVQADETHMPEEKENFTHPAPAQRRPPAKRPPPQRALPATAPAPRVAARGVRTILPKHVPAQPTQVAPAANLSRRNAGPQPAAGGKGKYSCPFCPFTFHESPGLYEHLSLEHETDTITNFRKPKGREGKTIVMRKPTPAVPGGMEPQMPVLVPVVSVEKGASGGEKRVVQHYQVVRNDPEQSVVEEDEEEPEQVVMVHAREPELFEDPEEPVRKMKGRVYHEDEEEEDEEVEEHVVESISQARASASPVKIIGQVRRIPQNDLDEEEGGEVAGTSAASRYSRGTPLVVATPITPTRKRKMEVVEDEEGIEVISSTRGRATRRNLEQVAQAVSPAKRGRGRPAKRGRR